MPVLADILDGSQSDKTWHRGVLDHLKKRLHIPLDVELQALLQRVWVNSGQLF